MKVAVVSGGTYGIGRAITLTLARDGFQVVAFGDNPDYGAGTERALAEAKLDGLVLRGDVATRADVERAVDETVQRFGRIDALCNNAAIRPTGTVLDTDEQTWDRILAVNLKGAYYFTRAVLPHMILGGGGAIVTTGSTSGYGGRDHIAYCTAKGALVPFAMSIALDHAKDRIRSNVVIPGVTLTGMTENFPQERLAARAAVSVAGRIGLPEDIANAVAFLVSDKAQTISGAVLEVGATHEQMVLGPQR